MGSEITRPDNEEKVVDEEELDFSSIDNSPLREPEIKMLRLLLERERARRRLAKKLKFYTGWLSIGMTGAVAGYQLGIIDWLAGLLIRLKH